MSAAPSKRRSIRYGKDAPQPSGSITDLQQLSLNSFFNKADDTQPKPSNEKRVHDLPSKNLATAHKPSDPSQILKGVIACLDIR